MSVQARWAEALVDALATRGLRQLWLSPGSRSGPWTLAALAHPQLQCHVVIDERQAAFMALGFARLHGQPAALLCTSGSAPAHYHPAVIEADAAAIPLLILSADRPWELHGCGAAQCTEQRGLFGPHLRASIDLPPASEQPEGLRAMLRCAAQAWAQLGAPMPGPVQLNLRARKPLEPATAPALGRIAEVAQSNQSQLYTPMPRWSASDMQELAATLLQAERPLMLAGPSHPWAASCPALVARLAERLQAPVLAEPTSQLCWLGDGWPVAAPRWDSHVAALASCRTLERWAPDVVLQLGAAPTASATLHALQHWPDYQHIVLTPHGWPVPSSRPATILQAPLNTSISALLAALEGQAAQSPARAQWCNRIAALDAKLWPRIDAARQAEPIAAPQPHAARQAGPDAVHPTGSRAALSEAESLWRLLHHPNLQAGSQLFLGNSLTVRHAGRFCRASRVALSVLSQRGVSGIDGNVAAAFGTATGASVPTIAVIGDVALLHDLGALQLARSYALQAPLLLVVLHNGGGRIFSELPVATHPVTAPHLAAWTTPHDLSFAAVSTALGWQHHSVRRPDELDAALGAALQTANAHLIEVHVPANDAAQRWHTLRQHLASAD
ncbi:MAG: 2-succinyl-5-enolpyruvyl-6-hydroxy-3-cyclohexene-1-carboxylic-acid synthase [Polyangiales bacterium]